MNRKASTWVGFVTVPGLLFLSATAGAVNLTWDSQYRAILKIYPHDDGLSITLDGAAVNPNSACPNRLMIQLTSTNYATKVAALIAAHAQGKRIMVNFDADWTLCDTPINRFETEN
jgi:thiol:disulfide interchange protein